MRDIEGVPIGILRREIGLAFEKASYFFRKSRFAAYSDSVSRFYTICTIAFICMSIIHEPFFYCYLLSPLVSVSCSTLLLPSA